MGFTLTNLISMKRDDINQIVSDYRVSIGRNLNNETRKELDKILVPSQLELVDLLEQQDIELCVEMGTKPSSAQQFEMQRDMYRHML